MTTACDCDCHQAKDDERACACCPKSGRWEDTCEWKRLNLGGHTACTPRVCAEEGER